MAEGWGYDAGVLLAEIATRTSRIELGTGVLNVWGRSPASIAMLASGLHAVSGGRFTLGLGAGSPQLAEGLHDVEFRAPVRRLGATARQVRALLDGERAVTSTGARGLRLAAPAPVPLHLAALGPAAVRLAGEVADAWVPFLQPRSGLKERICLLEDAAARAGRPRPRVAPGIPAALSPEVAAWWVAFYLTSMGPLYATSLREQGFGAAVDAVVAANGRGVPPTVPPAAQVLVDELLLTGAGELERWRAAGADLPALALPPGQAAGGAGADLRGRSGGDRAPAGHGPGNATGSAIAASLRSSSLIRAWVATDWRDQLGVRLDGAQLERGGASAGSTTKSTPSGCSPLRSATATPDPVERGSGNAAAAGSNRCGRACVAGAPRRGAGARPPPAARRATAVSRTPCRSAAPRPGAGRRPRIRRRAPAPQDAGLRATPWRRRAR